MLPGSHLPNLLLVHRARSKHPQQMLNSVSMAGMDQVGNLPCLRSHMKGSTSKPHPPKAHSKDISNLNPNHKHKPVLSLLRRMSSPHTIRQTPSSGMHTATTSSNMVSRVRRLNKKAPLSSKDHTAVTVAHKLKGVPNSLRVQLSSRSRDMPPLERVKRVATPLQTQRLRLSSPGPPRLLKVNQVTLNNPRPQTIHTATLTIRARTTPNT